MCIYSVTDDWEYTMIMIRRSVYRQFVAIACLVRCQCGQNVANIIIGHVVLELEQYIEYGT